MDQQNSNRLNIFKALIDNSDDIDEDNNYSPSECSESSDSEDRRKLKVKKNKSLHKVYINKGLLTGQASTSTFRVYSSEKEARMAAPAAPATSHGLMETSDGRLETIHDLPTASRPSNAVPPGTGDQVPGEVGITPESCQGAATKCQGNPRRSESQKCLSKGHLTQPGTSAPVAQLMDPATTEANSGTSG
ncbi:hypothetical protein J6590_108081, partial [Homalodisca vitripennis]